MEKCDAMTKYFIDLASEMEKKVIAENEKTGATRGGGVSVGVGAIDSILRVIVMNTKLLKNKILNPDFSEFF